MPRIPLAVALVLASVRIAAAGGDGIAVSAAGSLPFTADELRAALAIRLDGVEASIDVRGGDEPGVVLIRVDGVERAVAIGDRVDAAAARVVALSSLDLLADRDRGGSGGAELAPAGQEVDSTASADDAPPVPARPRRVSVRTEGDAERPAELTRVRQPASSAGGIRSVLASAMVRSDSSRRTGAAVRGELAMSERTAALVGVGYDREAGESATIGRLPVRVGLARVQPLASLRTSLSLALIGEWQRLALRDRGETLGHDAVRFGAGVGASVILPAAGPLGVEVAGGADLYASRHRFLVEGEQRLASSRVSIWLGVGLVVASGGVR